MRVTAMNARLRNRTGSPRSMAGVSLIELMISIVLGMMVIAALVTVFASTSASRQELERTSRQIENGRFAMEILSDELRLAGFYGELDMRKLAANLAGPMWSATPTPFDPCTTDPNMWKLALKFHVQGYDNGQGMPPCLQALVPDLKANTDVVITRRASSCEAGIAGCPLVIPTHAYMQVSKCGPESAIAANSYTIALGSGTFPLSIKGATYDTCGARAGLREYLVSIFYISTNNGQGQPIPTLKMKRFNGVNWDEYPMVEGIEELNIEYGIDNDLDGAPDAYTTDVTGYTCANAQPDNTACTPSLNWSNVMTARVHLLARNLETSPNYTDNKTYSLGLDRTGAEITITPNDAYRRHVYAGLVRIVNPAQRRDTP